MTGWQIFGLVALGCAGYALLTLGWSLVVACVKRYGR